MEAAKGFLEEAIFVAPSVDAANQLRELRDLYDKRLWHNVTLKIIEIIDLPELKRNVMLIQLYTNFIKTFESKLNQLTLAKILVVMSKSIVDDNEAVQFLDAAATKLKLADQSVEPSLLLRAVIAQLKLKDTKNVEECKKLLESIQETLDGVTGVDPVVYSNFYRAQAEYYKIRDRLAEYYRFALLYLSYTPLESLDDEEKRSFAYNLGIAALVGEETYNFGDLLAHPIVDSLKGSDKEWLAQLLRTFNQGDMEGYQNLIAQYGPQLESEPQLLAKADLLKEKISILRLMEMVFERQAVDRHIPFSIISVPPEMDLELLVMKALSLKLIKGYIDQVEKQLVVTWVQPRVLGLEQIAKMKDRLDEWTKRVHSTLIFMEQGTPDLFS